MGNPLRPIVNDVVKYGPLKVTEPSSHLRAIEKYYRQMITDGRSSELTKEQIKYFGLAIAYNNGAAGFTRVMSKLKKAMDVAKEQGNEETYQKHLKSWKKLRSERTQLAQKALGQIKD